MGQKDILLKEIEQIPEALLDEAVDFVKFLKVKIVQEKFGVAIASGSSLKKDWLLPEEDEGWQNL